MRHGHRIFLLTVLLAHPRSIFSTVFVTTAVLPVPGLPLMYMLPTVRFSMCVLKKLYRVSASVRDPKLGHFAPSCKAFFTLFKHAVVFWLVGSQRSHPLRVSHRRKAVRWTFNENYLVFVCLCQRGVLQTNNDVERLPTLGRASSSHHPYTYTKTSHHQNKK